MKTVLGLALCALLANCSKERSSESGNYIPIAKDKAFHSLITTPVKKFTPVAFYADKPIDFDPYDSIDIQETDLWHYTAYYLKDDEYVFYKPGNISIAQNGVHHPTVNGDTLLRQFKVSLVDNEVVFDFVDQNYDPYPYFLHEMGSDYFILYTRRDSVKLFSRYNAY